MKVSRARLFSRSSFLQETQIDGLPVRVVELHGNAGDVFITHARVFHSIAVNANDEPRMMRSGAIWRAT
jgi:hypothetical protein